MRARHRLLALALIVGAAAMSLAACTEVEESESTYSPTSVKPIEGRDDDAQEVTFNAEAARRADVDLDRVRAAGRHTSIPYAALIYAEDGDTYTYVSPKPLVYRREPIVVDRIAGERVVLRRGPPVGTTIVTTGAAEVYSAEFGVEE